ncbi:MAG: ABC transporter permease [Alphaproteobacteria bacterium]|uniref:ABC transporter permease n=1 Tax=Aestuariivirga sp. TaxID=2650926 RepID=UPI003018F58C|nr:ABC transporter permease [Alphaproteobacteria bacterium]
MLWETVKLAMSSIRRNVLRSVLTLLGIVIGVGAVIAMVTLGNGASSKVQDNLAKLGSNMLIVRPGQTTFGPGGTTDARSFDERDVTALKNDLSGIRGVAPTAQKQMKVVSGALNYDATVNGTNADWFTVQDWTMEDGRVFSESELRAGASVCVIGATITRELFAGQDPIGERLRIGNFSCEVIGKMAAKGQSAFGTDQDAIVVLPLRTYHRRIAGNTRIGTIAISVTEAADIPRVQRDAEDVLRERRRIAPGEEDDFTIRDLTQILATMASTTAILTGLLGAVAAVSLLVGGIGIMNIMLVSVTERTREIGIRLAIGALERQVLTQFLVEAVVLALFGGVLGIAIGLGLAAAGSMAMDVPFNADLRVIALAFAVSALIGVIFGYFPARRAARLDPIEALRRE